MAFSGIGRTLLIAFLLVGVIPALLIGIITINESKKHITELIHHSLDAIAESKEALVYSYLDQINTRAIDFASDGHIKQILTDIPNNSDKSSAIKDLTNYIKASKLPVSGSVIGISVVSTLYKNGTILASTS